MDINLKEIKKKLYFKKANIIYKKALSSGKITEFEEEIFEKMSTTIISCLPVSLLIKYSNYLFAEGTCYERSLYMFLALDNALLVRGKNKSLEYRYGKDNEGHGWIEIGDYVYDPSFMLKFDKNTYYSIYQCTNIKKIDKETYLCEHADFVEKFVSHNFEEFKPFGKRRLELGIIITQLKALNKLLNDKNFNKDLNGYLNLIEYDENQIHGERQKAIFSILDNKENITATIGRKL